MRRTIPNLLTPALAVTLALGGLISGPGCGPSDNSSGNQNQADAYVFPDSSPRPDAAPCEDRCSSGTTQCVTGGLQTCGDFDTDVCTEWGPVEPCGIGETCSNGTCGCASDCTQGSVKCNDDGTGTQSCVDDGSGCWTWDTEVLCTGTDTCSAGACSGTCVEECVTGTRECDGDGYKECGDYDSDVCLDWGPVIACTAGETCSNGYCDTGCTNECTAGAVQCDGTTGTQACGDYDSDSCLELGPIVPCAPGETCSNGACDTTCSDECPATTDTQCTTSGSGYQVCDYYGASTCLTWGPAINCDLGDTCSGGTCDTVCDCDFTSGICEPDSPGVTTACSCDPDCTGGSACASDGHCDSWCPPDSDLDCDCGCDYNEYCEAGTQGGTDTCACDPDCELNEVACEDDGHCDTWCAAGWDPDCGEDACRDRWMLVGYREADQMWLDGAYNDPDSVEGSPWVELSPGLSSGSAETFVEFAAENMGCVSSISIDAWGYDDSVFGDGAEVYIYNWDTYQFDLLSDATINTPEGWFTNTALDPAPYLLCGSGAEAKCYINVKIGASAWDQTHLWDMEVYVHMTP
jgi:hypothetical protein